jgi:peroxiredoxin
VPVGDPKTAMIDIERLLVINVGQNAPALTATTLDGETFDLAKQRGKVVLVDFWATWCTPCVAELPHIREAYEKYKARGFVVLGVSMDDDEGPVRQFVKRNVMPWPVCAPGPEGENPIAEAYNVAGIPATFLIDREGKVVAKQVTGEALDRELQKLFPAESLSEAKP